MEDPWEVFKEKAIKYGRNSPSPIVLSSSPIQVPIPEFCNILPNTPPAPVMKITGAACNRDSPIHPVDEMIFLSNFFGKNKLNKIPINKAMIGCPMKIKIGIWDPSPSGLEGYFAKEAKTININGIITGANDFKALG